jgi:hypothetical protein
LKIIEDGVSPAIKELIDGFTYQLKDGKVVRLIGINSNKNAQDKTEEIDVDTNAYELPPQGTIIPCELCVILYPERYEKEPQTCLICQGAKEHFQPAQMMTREMAQMQLYELDLKIQQLMYQTIMDSLSKPVDLGQLKKMHKLYKRKLIHLLVYDFLEVEPVKENILQLDEMIKKYGQGTVPAFNHLSENYLMVLLISSIMWDRYSIPGNDIFNLFYNIGFDIRA